MLLLRKALSHKECVIVCVLQSEAGTACYSSQRVFRYVEWYIDFFVETFVQTSDKSSTTGKENTSFYNILIQFRGSLFQNLKDCRFDFCQ